MPRVCYACGRTLLTIVAVLLFTGGCKKTLKAYPDSLAGVGIVLQTTGAGQAISRVVPGSPAAEAGVQVGDRILAVDGQSVDGQSLSNVVASLRGQIGTQVVVRLRRESGDVTTTMTRQPLTKTKGGYRVE